MNLPTSNNTRIAKYYAKLGRNFAKLGDNVDVTHEQTLDSDRFASYVLDFHYADGESYAKARTADTWDLRNGRQVMLRDLFKRKRGVKRKLVNALLDSMNLGDNRGTVKRQLHKNIDEEKFYLANDGLHLFTASRREFVLSYEVVGITH